MAYFSLLDESWVPVVDLDGIRRLVSLRESLQNAAAYSRIDGGHPLQTIALYRLHLALLHRALNGPASTEETAAWYTTGLPVEPVERYLTRYAGRFDLFGQQPFLQVPGLHLYTEASEGGKSKSFKQHWSWLTAFEGRANTTALFNPFKMREEAERDDTISVADVIPMLLEHLTFTLGGLLHAFTTNPGEAPSARSALFLVEGPDLEKTFVLNLVDYPSAMRGERDQPFWESGALTPKQIKAMHSPGQPRVIQGYAQHYTWPSRSVELHLQGDAVDEMGYAAGIPFKRIDLEPGQATDPMTALVALKKGTYRTYQLDTDRLLWRDFDAFLAGARLQPPRIFLHAVDVLKKVRSADQALTPRLRRSQADPLPRLSVFGQYGPSNREKLLGARYESYTLPQKLVDDPKQVRDEVSLALESADRLGRALHKSVSDLCTELLKQRGRTPDELEVDPKRAAALAAQIPAEPTYWARLDTPFRAYLLALDRDPIVALADWHAALSRAALTGWRIAQEAAGMNAVGLRAVQLAFGPLGRELSKLTLPEERPTEATA